LDRQPVSSTSIESIGYDGTTAILQIEFVEGRLYEYFMVPQSVYAGLMRAESKGRFYGEFVRAKYQFRQI
jgi:hypothetical protein